MTAETPRYAIYFAPAAATPLWRFGSSVLGYDAASGDDTSFHWSLASAWSNWPTLTAEPRRYGFHATLKAPFRLRDGMTASGLLTAAQAIASSTPSCELQGLEVAALGRFVALVPLGPVEAVRALAARVVDAFDEWRAPMSNADRERRLVLGLTPAQAAYLDAYGYPYVHDEFRFHMTLTGRLPVDLLPRVRERLSASFAEAVPPGPVAIDAISIFRQDHTDARFRVIARLPLMSIRQAAQGLDE